MTTPAARPLYVVGVNNFTLFATRCPCGELTVHGFWQQVPKVVRRDLRRAWLYFRCDACGAVRTKAYRLSSARARPRLVNWYAVGGWVLRHVFPRIPARWRHGAGVKLLRAVAWLDRRVPI